MDKTDQLWKSVLDEIRQAISPANFATWFKDVSIEREEGGTVYLSVPNSFTQDWLEKKFHKMILEILKGFNADISDLRYVSGGEDLETKPLGRFDYGTRHKLDDLNEKSESLLTRVVFLTGKIESLIGRVGHLTSAVSELTSK